MMLPRYTLYPVAPAIAVQVRLMLLVFVVVVAWTSEDAAVSTPPTIAETWYSYVPIASVPPGRCWEVAARDCGAIVLPVTSIVSALFVPSTTIWSPESHGLPVSVDVRVDRAAAAADVLEVVDVVAALAVERRAEARAGLRGRRTCRRPLPPRIVPIDVDVVDDDHVRVVVDGVPEIGCRVDELPCCPSRP